MPAMRWNRKTMSIDRVKKQWWVVTDTFEAILVTGYSCAPNSKDHWWVPSLGMSMSNKFHLFEDERDAIAKAGKELDEKIESLLKRRKELEAQLAGAT